MNLMLLLVELSIIYPYESVSRGSFCVSRRWLAWKRLVESFRCVCRRVNDRLVKEGPVHHKSSYIQAHSLERILGVKMNRIYSH